MQRPRRLLLITAAVLLVPIVPFVIWGEPLEAAIRGWFDPPPSPWALALAVVAVLSTDVFLPVPSSFVSTLAGTQLSIAAATVASWTGMTAGSVIGFALARWIGRPLAVRFSDPDELDRLDEASRRYGPWTLVACRALPVLAEASVLLAGTTRLAWRRFFIPVALANLGIAAAYSVLGHYGRAYRTEIYVLAAAVLVPLMAAAIARGRLSHPAASHTP